MDQTSRSSAIQATPNTESLAEMLLKLRDDNNVSHMSLSRNSEGLNTPLTHSNSSPEEETVIDPRQQEAYSDVCNCRKSRCLKLYCQCFSNKALCGPLCRCQQCENRDENSVLRMQAMRTVLEKNPQGFESKYTAGGIASQHKEDPAVPAVAHRHGCRCRKSFCLKKYCECYQGKVFCSSICSCTDCHNGPDGPYVSNPAPLMNRAHSLSSLENNTVVYYSTTMSDLQFMHPAVLHGFTVKGLAPSPTAHPPLKKRRMDQQSYITASLEANANGLTRAVTLGSPFTVANSVTPQGHQTLSFFATHHAPQSAVKSKFISEENSASFPHATPMSLSIAQTLSSLGQAPMSALPPRPPRTSPPSKSAPQEDGMKLLSNAEYLVSSQSSTVHEETDEEIPLYASTLPSPYAATQAKEDTPPLDNHHLSKTVQVVEDSMSSHTSDDQSISPDVSAKPVNLSSLPTMSSRDILA